MSAYKKFSRPSVPAPLTNPSRFAAKEEIDRRLLVCFGCEFFKNSRCTCLSSPVIDKAKIARPLCERWELPLVRAEGGPDGG
ncbi:MAG: hypothetical protein KGL39_07995 [Patescibacteria group bacterium]|nr:hypothetical protein [Patescibacteria group bacterium]